MSQVIIGIAGKMASGKGRISEYLLNQYDVDKAKTSHFLRQVLDIFGIPQSRENLHHLSTFLRKTYGEDTLARALVRYAKQATKLIILIDGIRRATDIKNLKELPNFYLIYVDVEQKIRYQRYIQRNENPGDAEMTFEIFQREDAAEPEQQIESLKEHAKFILDNNGTTENLDVQIEKMLDAIIPIRQKKMKLGVSLQSD